MPLKRVIHIAEFRASLRSFLRNSERVSTRWGLTPQRYLLLLMIQGAPDGSRRLNFTELADRLQLSRNATTELVSRAEELGLLQREPSEHDQRVVYLRLTKDGRRRLCGALLESDNDRRALIHGFDELTASFKRASKQR